MPWVIDGVLVFVPDVEAHHARAKKEGATILSELEERPPARRYRVEDLEGHRWMFMERRRSNASSVSHVVWVVPEPEAVRARRCPGR